MDARDPLGTRCKDIEMQILQEDPSKKIVLVLNKIDLVPRENLQQWLKYLRTELPTIAFKSAVQNSRSRIGQLKMSAEENNQIGTSECLGATTLLSLLKNYSRSRDVKLSITVGIIGLPNVGKSSLINRYGVNFLFSFYDHKKKSNLTLDLNLFLCLRSHSSCDMKNPTTKSR